MNDMYTRDCCKYTVFASHAKSKFQEGVALFYKTHNNTWWIEGERAHGPNVMSCILVSGKQRWNVIGTYIPPSESNGKTVNFINEAVQYCSTKDPYILLGSLNADLDHPKDICNDNITTMVLLLGLDDIGDQFAHPSGWWTWSMQHESNYKWSKTDYILAQELYDFKCWAIKIPQINTNHHAIIAEMKKDCFYIH
jgi:hypothetical protein